MESRDGKYGRQKIKGKAEFHASATDAFDTLDIWTGYATEFVVGRTD
jgi:hypothetical protein